MPTEIYQKNCPGCGCSQIYTTKASLKHAVRKNLACPKCANYSRRKPTGKSTGINKNGEPDKRIGNIANPKGGGRPKNSKFYWIEEEMNKYIMEYQRLLAAPDSTTAHLNNHYETYLRKPFEKLVENILNRFPPEYFLQNEDWRSLHNSAVGHLVTNVIKGYDVNKGKSFSYFSISAKNFIMAGNIKSHTNNTKFESLDKSIHGENDDETLLDKLVEPNTPTVESENYEEYQESIHNKIINYINYWTPDKINEFAKGNPNRIKAMNAILTALKNPELVVNKTEADMLETPTVNTTMFGKKIIYTKIRELLMPDVEDKKELVKCIKSLCHYNRLAGLKFGKNKHINYWELAKKKKKHA